MVLVVPMRDGGYELPRSYAGAPALPFDKRGSSPRGRSIAAAKIIPEMIIERFTA